MPRLSFGHDELEALVLGLREVEEIGDVVLSAAAKQALAKLKARLPEEQTKRLQHAVLTAKRLRPRPVITVDVAALRKATWDEMEISFRYTDAKGTSSTRSVRPLSIAYLEHNTCLVSWCLLRKDTRIFRLDRMADLEVTSASFRPQRVALLRSALAQIRAKSAYENDQSHGSNAG